jgi:uncharacterized protein YjbJ (UPF0337 family)
MTIENRVEATAKNIEGKIQEAVSEVTGNQKDKLEGQAKQDMKEDLKDKAKEIVDRA